MSSQVKQLEYRDIEFYAFAMIKIVQVMAPPPIYYGNRLYKPIESCPAAVAVKRLAFLFRRNLAQR